MILIGFFNSNMALAILKCVIDDVIRNLKCRPSSRACSFPSEYQISLKEREAA